MPATFGFLLLLLLASCAGDDAEERFVGMTPRAEWHDSHEALASEEILHLAAPLRHLRDGYVSSRACKSCHPGEYRSWYESHHRRMTQRSTPDAVLPPWRDGTVLHHDGRSYQLLRRDGQFWVDMPRYGTAGSRVDERMQLPVVMTTGSHHFQLFWLALPWVGDGAADGRREYQERCVSCHGASNEDEHRGVAESLVQRELYREDVFRALDDDRHGAELAGTTRTERSHLVDFVERLQAPGRLTQFPLSWSVTNQRWAHEDHTFLAPPEPRPDVEPYEQTWGDACDQCHSVAPRRERSLDAASKRLYVAELGVACEACHGPGRGHLERHEWSASAGAAERHFQVPDVTNPNDLEPEQASAVCGQCHADTLDRGPRLSTAFRPGDHLEQHTRVLTQQQRPYPEWLDAALEEDENLLSGAFWADGTMRVAGRNYNAFLNTPCFTQGRLGCSSCHQMHGANPNDQLRPAARGNGVCLSCHDDVARNVSAHTHHPQDSSGSVCYNCHSPRTTLGLLKIIRSHRIDSPSARTSAETGKPLACSLCHLDMTLQQTAEVLSTWYGHPTFDDQHPERDVPLALRQLLSGDAAQRAVAAGHFGLEAPQQASGRAWLAPVLARLLDDPYAAVRRIAARALATMPAGRNLEYDYVAPSPERQRAQQAVIQRWRSRAANIPGDPRVSFTRKALDSGLLERLSEQRDDTPIVVNE